MKTPSHAALDILIQIKKWRNQTKLQPLERLNPDNIKKILVISCTALGDTLFATPAIRSLHRLVPGAAIDLLARDRFASLFRSNPFISNLLPYRGRCRGSLALASRFRENRYDMCISLHDSDPCPIKAAWLAGIPFIFRLGQRDEKCAGFLSERAPYRPEAHAIEQRLDVIRMIFGSRANDACAVDMVLPASDDEALDFWQAKLISSGINTGKNIQIAGFQFSASGIYKTWPEKNWISLGQQLLAGFPKAVIALFGSPGEKIAASRLKASIEAGTGREGRVINLAGDMMLSQLPAALKGLSVFVTNDTGPLHAAVAVRTPTVSLFVPTRISCIAPIQDRELHTVIKKEPPCTPCVEKYCKSPRCMELIGTQEVFDRVAAILSRNGTVQ